MSKNIQVNTVGISPILRGNDCLLDGFELAESSAAVTNQLFDVATADPKARFVVFTTSLADSLPAALAVGWEPEEWVGLWTAEVQAIGRFRALFPNRCRVIDLAQAVRFAANFEDELRALGLDIQAPVELELIRLSSPAIATLVATRYLRGLNNIDELTAAYESVVTVLGGSCDPVDAESEDQLIRQALAEFIERPDSDTAPSENEQTTETSVNMNARIRELELLNEVAELQIAQLQEEIAFQRHNEEARVSQLNPQLSGQKLKVESAGQALSSSDLQRGSTGWLDKLRSIVRIVLMSPKMRRQIRMLRESPLFDASWYVRTYPDVRQAALAPEEHYLRFGAEEGRDPSPHFSSFQYLYKHPEVRQAGANPLIHHLENV